MSGESKNSLSRRDFLKTAGAFIGAALISPHLPRIELETDHDILGTDTLKALAERSSSFICKTPGAAITMSQQLRGLPDGHPSYISGPLSMAQLDRIISFGVPPKDFWLASPQGPYAKTDLFARTFPESEFTRTEVHDSVTTHDFNSEGLMPGDFLYLYGGTFDHMLTVSRRDEKGILYAVTNYIQDDGSYIINEVSVWNPSDPEASFLRKLGKGIGPNKARSGNGGYTLWRLKEAGLAAYERFDRTNEAEKFRQELDTLTENCKGDWHILIKDLKSDKIIAEENSRVLHHPASVIKVPIAMAVMHQLENEFQNKGSKDVLDYTKEKGFEGRTFEQLLSAMLVESEEDATSSLLDFLEERNLNLSDLFHLWGADFTITGPRTSTAFDTMQLFSGLYQRNDIFKQPACREYLLDLLSQETAADKTRLGILKKRDDMTIEKIYNKRGTMVEQSNIVVADAGIIELTTGFERKTDRTYFISLTGSVPPDKHVSYEELEEEINKLITAFAEYCPKGKRVRGKTA